MHEHEVELSVGDVIQVGSYTVTVIDIEGDEVSVRIDSDEQDQELLLNAGGAFRAR